jgi:hypothetical protein
LFQLQDGFGNTGLGGVQGFGGFRQVELAPNSFLDESKLVQVHDGQKVSTAQDQPAKGAERDQGIQEGRHSSGDPRRPLPQVTNEAKHVVEQEKADADHHTNEHIPRQNSIS